MDDDVRETRHVDVNLFIVAGFTIRAFVGDADSAQASRTICLPSLGAPIPRVREVIWTAEVGLNAIAWPFWAFGMLCRAPCQY
jgi:hypothetical protein